MTARNASCRCGQLRANVTGVATFHFCPDCGSDVYYLAGDEDLIAIPLGAFDDLYFAKINYSVYESRKQPWFGAIEAADHYD